MSRKHSAQTYQVHQLIKQIEGLDQDTLYQDYSVEIVDGIVYDDCYEKEFSSLVKWAEFTVEMELLEDEEDDEIMRKHFSDE